MVKSVLTTAITIIVISGCLFAQEFDVREFKADPSDLAAIRFPKRSVNDEPCALIKVITNIQGMQFDSNQGIVDIVHQDEGYWLYVAPRERRIRLMAEGFLPLDIAMPEPAVENRVYNLIVTATGLHGNLELIPINIIVDGHNDAIVEIDGEPFPIAQTISLPRGSQQISIQKPGYRTIYDQIEVSETHTLFRYQMEGINEEVVTINTNPTGATVYINNVRQNRTSNLQEFLFPGEYSIRITLSEYKDIETSVTVVENGANSFDFELEKFGGTLVLNLTPSDAKISINQRDYSGEREIQFAPGTYRLVAEKQGYQTTEDRFVIQEGQRTVRNINLIPRTGSLRFIAMAPDARFSLYNQEGELIDSWQGSKILRDVKIGDYRINGQLEGFANLSGNVAITEDQETKYEAEFSEEQRLIAIREQERIAMEERRQQQQAQQTTPSQPHTTTVPATSSGQSTSLFKQESLDIFHLSYTSMSLNTKSFEQNIYFSGGATAGFTSVAGYFGLNMGLAYNVFEIDEEFHPQFGSESVTALSFFVSMGPKIRIGVFEFFVFPGFEYENVSHDSFEEESINAGDMIIEYGVIFLPRNWLLGLRFGQSQAVGITDGYPPFSRTEIGLVFSF